MAETTRVIEFDVADNTYCIDIAGVDQVIRPGELSDAPNLADSAEGVMTFRDTAVEVWDATKLLSNDDAANVERQRKLDAQLEDSFDDIEDTIERLVDRDVLTDAEAAEELIGKIADLREEIVTGHVEVDRVLDQHDVIVLSPQFKNEERRIGWLVDEVKDVRVVSRDDLDESVGGSGVYGVIREDVEDTDEEGDEEAEEDVTIWVDPQALLNEET